MTEIASASCLFFLKQKREKLLASPYRDLCVFYLVPILRTVLTR